MKLFRNPEFFRAFLFGTVLSLVAAVLAFVWDSRFGWLMTAVCAVFLTLFYGFTHRRYRRLASLAADLDKILHGDTAIPLDAYAEGELAILQNELHKMTVRLREQRQQLLDDKVFLADSLADISHQIRTPLTSVNLLVSFLADPTLAPERRQEVTRELYALLSRMDWLITTLLKMSKLDAGTIPFNPETVTFSQLLQKATAPVLVPMELRGQTLHLTAEGNFCGDVAWTSEALTNIIKNCMEHTPDGGCITVVATENPLYSEIVVTDTGSGIAQDDLPHIFERFYKGENSDKNSFGIGLSLARTIITAQNGTVKAENILPHGAKFTLHFYNKGTV